MITHWSSHTRNAKMKPVFLKKHNEDETWAATNKHTAKTWPRGGLGFGQTQESLGKSTNNILGLSSDGIWFRAFNDKLSRVWAEHGETTVWAKMSQQRPSLLSGKPWLETKWTGTRRYTGSVTQPIMASLTQPKAPGKHNRLRLHNSNTETRTYCFILSFWGPNLGPVGPRLENTYKY